ncbi:hypothetical protein PB01_15180 [Psychrobacillus glaciei]|uniref:Uncharacterized protein n=1 Tax=Psychrobacillus glaciei TaxID=2283160 RepID=A0A5J6SPZ8_9BACI|nr:hypothetical protein [Psychrobacillus glaciei]QFG00059.1 hypothetical protein PB01_15180 [Psychrobacillus glaciei]
MKKNLNKVLGATFMILSGFFYTAERIAKRVADSIVESGYASQGMSTSGLVYFPGFFDNFFVWLFFFIGFLLFIYGFSKRFVDIFIKNLLHNDK